MKFVMSLRYTLGRFVFKFHKIRFGDDVIMTSLSFLQTIVHISNSIEPTNFVHGINTQQYTIHLILKMIVTLTVTGEGQRSQKWSNEHISQTVILAYIIPSTKVIGETTQSSLTHLILLRSIFTDRVSKELSPLAHEWTSIKPPSSHQKFLFVVKSMATANTNIFLAFFLLVLPPKYAQYHFYRN